MGNTDFGPWEWGGTMNFHEIIQNSKNGELRIKFKELLPVEKRWPR